MLYATIVHAPPRSRRPLLLLPGLLCLSYSAVIF